MLDDHIPILELARFAGFRHDGMLVPRETLHQGHLIQEAHPSFILLPRDSRAHRNAEPACELAPWVAVVVCMKKKTDKGEVVGWLPGCGSMLLRFGDERIAMKKAG